MRVWRICKKSDTEKLSGLGGLYVSGRWHHRGYKIIYTSSTPSLSAMEFLVHVDPATAPADLVLLEINVPDDLMIESCIPSLLTPNWQDNPPPTELQDFGTQWLIECRTPILSVPSVIIALDSIERNYLINPEYFGASRISIVNERPFGFDPRFLKTH